MSTYRIIQEEPRGFPWLFLWLACMAFIVYKFVTTDPDQKQTPQLNARVHVWEGK